MEITLLTAALLDIPKLDNAIGDTATDSEGAAAEYVPVRSKYDELIAADAAAAAGGGAGADGEELDELDATMAELLEG